MKPFRPPAPKTDSFHLTRVRVPAALVAGGPTTTRADGLVDCEIVVRCGRIESILSPGSGSAGPAEVLDMANGLVLPRFVDVHTHLDKGFIWDRSPNPDGTFWGALSTVMADREARWSTEDVRRRMDFGLRCAFAHGTGAIRTHLDSLGRQSAISWPLFAEMRAEWASRITLQAVSIFASDMAADDPEQFAALVGHIVKAGGILGGVTFQGRAPDAKLDLALTRIFDAATANGLDLDFHVDESDSPDARTLERIADFAITRRFKGRIVAGHCCSLALASVDDRRRVIEKVGEAGIAVVSLPMCNMYLQDRKPDRTPRWRGVAPLHELADAGVPALVASDNTRDPFYAYGDLDMLEVFREATRILQLDHRARDWTSLVGPAPAAVMGLADTAGTIAAGRSADLVLTGARTLNELLSRPQSDRIVLVGGRAIDTTPPDYRELDDLYA
jgi:cytosine deaminase